MNLCAHLKAYILVLATSLFTINSVAVIGSYREYTFNRAHVILCICGRVHLPTTIIYKVFFPILRENYHQLKDGAR